MKRTLHQIRTVVLLGLLASVQLAPVAVARAAEPAERGLLAAILAGAHDAQAAEENALALGTAALFALADPEPKLFFEPKVYDYLSQSEYEALRDLSLRILERYPVERYRFVGLGRSPAPIIAFFESLAPDLAFTMPGSGLKRRLSRNSRRAFRRTFDRLATERGVFADAKELVLLDFVQSGKSLRQAGRILRGHLRKQRALSLLSKRHIPKLEIVSIFDSSSPHYNETSAASGFDVAAYPTLVEHFAGQAYDRVAEYKAWFNRLEAPKRNDQRYGQFKAGMMRRMKADPLLVKAVTSPWKKR